MIRQYELLEKVKAYNENADIALLNRAYVFSMKAHGNQKRASGEPYLTHPLEVASVLADLQLDDASIAVGLLHDTLEDTLATYEELKDLFGVEIADLTDGVTKLSRIEFNNKQIEQAENYRKFFLAMAKDIRVLLIKLADRLHNMRTIHHIKKPEKRQRIAQETMDIYVPLADRIGLYNLKTELEDISFKQLNPEEYDRIASRKEYLQSHDDHIQKVIESLKDELEEAGIDAEVSGREKANYSIHRKMVQKNLTFDQLTDIIAYRIVVDNKAMCYEVLGLIHNVYKAIPGRFKDYVSSPKPNGYQSLHTSVIGPFGSRMEIQIRTQEMHEVAEAGVAAHWLYKQASGDKKVEGTQYKWLRQLMDMLQNTEDAEEFLENTKLDLFNENVFVYTPNGDLVSLPQGATPLDFAYHIHSEVGNKAQTARVNNRVVPLRTRLNNGDQVEIITAKNQVPTHGWLGFVVSGKARAAINRFLRAQELDEQIALGQEILEKSARRDSYAYPEKDLQKVVKEYGLQDIDDLYAGIAQGRVFPRQIFNVLFPDRQVEQTDEEAVRSIAQPVKVERRDTRVAIDGLTSGMAIHIAKCCNPVPGEDIVGIINTGHGITIHGNHCKTLDQFQDAPDRWLPVRWSGDYSEGEDGQVFVARLRITMVHEPGALSNLTTTVFNTDGNIVAFNTNAQADDTYLFDCDIEVKNAAHLERILSSIRNLQSVISVERRLG